MLLVLTLSGFFILMAVIKKYLFPGYHYHNYLSKGFGTFCSMAFILAMVSQPKIVFEGSVTGLETWLQIVLPSLLPFFIASELLMAFGIVHFMGILLEPVMRPVFNLPGAGAFVLAIGYTSGFPIGAMVTAKLRKQRLCTRVEAERLVCFTNNSSPLFMLVAVSVGMFHNPELGLIITGAHYLASLTLGIGLRFYGRKDREIITRSSPGGNVIKRAFQQMMAIQSKENRPLGIILSSAVKNSISNLLTIGGFIILFAVLIRIFTNTGIIHWIGHCLGYLFIPLGLSPELLQSLSSGFFEMTIGTKLASEAAAPLLPRLITVAMILGWSGLSVHAQVAGMLAETDIRMWPFILSRCAHAILAALFTYILAGPAHNTITNISQPVFSAFGQQVITSPTTNLFFFLLLFTVIIISSAGLVIFLYLLKELKQTIWR